MTREDIVNSQDQFLLAKQSTTIAALLGSTVCKILLNSGPTKSFISKQNYLRNKSLHRLPKFSSKAKVVQVSKEASVNILFISSVIITSHGHKFEIDTMVSKQN